MYPPAEVLQPPPLGEGSRLPSRWLLAFPNAKDFGIRHRSRLSPKISTWIWMKLRPKKSRMERPRCVGVALLRWSSNSEACFLQHFSSLWYAACDSHADDAPNFLMWKRSQGWVLAHCNLALSAKTKHKKSSNIITACLFLEGIIVNVCIFRMRQAWKRTTLPQRVSKGSQASGTRGEGRGFKSWWSHVGNGWKRVEVLALALQLHYEQYRELTWNLKSWRFGSDDFDLFNWGDFLGSKL